MPTELTKSVVIDEKLLLYPLGYFSEGQVAYNEEWDKIAGLFRFRWKALKGSSRSQLLSLPHKPKRWGDPTSPGEHQKNVYFHLAASLGDVPSQSVIDPTYASQSIRSKRTPHLRKASHNSSSLNVQPSLAECFLAFEPNLLFRVERESMLLGQTQ